MAPMMDVGSATPVGPTHDDRVMRASDADREATVVLLQDAVARGLLTPDEGSERMAAAFGAVYRADLPSLTADLPRADVRIRARGWKALPMKICERVGYFAAFATTSARAQPLRAIVVLLIVLVSMCVLGLIFGHVWFGGAGHGGSDGGPDFGRPVGRRR